MRAAPRRLAPACLGIAFLGVGTTGWIIERPSVGIGRQGVSIGWLPFWAAAGLALGAVIVVLILAVERSRSFAAWSSCVRQPKS